MRDSKFGLALVIETSAQVRFVTLDAPKINENVAEWRVRAGISRRSRGETAARVQGNSADVPSVHDQTYLRRPVCQGTPGTEWPRVMKTCRDNDERLGNAAVGGTDSRADGGRRRDRHALGATRRLRSAFPFLFHARWAGRRVLGVFRRRRQVGSVALSGLLGGVGTGDRETQGRLHVARLVGDSCRVIQLFVLSVAVVPLTVSCAQVPN
jgi:hypothetical protein